MIGIFGGTFDPVHLGHLGVAEYVRDALSLDEIRFIPAGVPYHRTGTVSAGDHRLAMLESAVQAYAGFTVDRRELDRKGPTYTVDTLRELHAEEQDRPLFLLMGTDTFNSLPQWQEFAAIPELACIVVMHRPDHPLPDFNRVKNRLNTDEDRIIGLDVPQIPISATLVRDRCAKQDTIDALVPVEVAAYIQKHQLY